MNNPNNLQIFNNTNFGEIRTVEINGKTYFVASDIAKALGYKNQIDAIQRHCKGVVKYDTLTNGGMQQVNVIPESDVYRLIAHSQLPSAVEFEKWLFEEVIPSIHKTGVYGQPDLSNLDVLYSIVGNMREQEKKLKQVENDINQIKQIQEQAKSFEIPKSDKPVNELSKRSLINMIVRNYSVKHLKPINEVFEELYYQFKYRYHIDLEARSKNTKGKKSKLEICEELGKIEELYALASELFK